MRNEIFKYMEQSRIDYFKKVKFEENPNPFKNRVEEEEQKPLLLIQRVYHHDEKDEEDDLKKEDVAVKEIEDAVIENLTRIRITRFLNRCYALAIKACRDWFEIPIPQSLVS